MEQNQEAIKLATLATLIEVGKRVLMNAGDDIPVPYVAAYKGEPTTGEWVAERFGAALNKYLQEQKIVEAAQ